MDKTIENKTLKELKARFDALCDEQEQLPRDGFAKVFEVLDSLEEDFTPQHPYTENEDNINKALELTGHSTDEAFCKAFKRNNQIMIEGKKIQRLGIEISFQQGKFAKPQQEPKPDEWIFLTPSIVVSPELRPVLDKLYEKELCKDNGIFSCFTDIPEEDEDDDEFMMIDAYGIQCGGLQVYYRDLQQFGVLNYLKAYSSFFKKVLKASLLDNCTFIKENTEKPNKVRNHIRESIKWFDSLPVWGLIFQILILQGLISWFENINLNEGDRGYKDAKLLGQWIMKILLEKEVSFCYFLWGDGDKEKLKPLCGYLLSTQVGQAVQERIRARNNDQTTSEPQQEKPEPPKTLPRKLKDDEAKSLRALLINQNQIATGTEEETFLYWFGCGKYREGIKPITWTGTKQIARELLEGLYKSEDSSFADIEKTVPMCFMKDGKPMKLAKNKEVPSLGSDAVANFLATIKKN